MLAQQVALIHPSSQPEVKKIQKQQGSLAVLLKDIEKHSNVRFNYNSDLVQDVLVTWDVDKIQPARFESTLIELIRPKGFILEKINGNNYVIYKDNPPLKRTPPVKTTQVKKDYQAMDVQGKVTDAEGVALPGVSVSLKENTGIGAVTDADGTFSVNVPNGNGTLVFSYIGFATQEIPVNNRSQINVTMGADTKALQEVVVVGYGTQKREDLTSSIGYVSAKEIEDKPIVQVGQALQGKVAGLQVAQNSGSPGSGLMVRIRGVGTVNNSEPLYVVDGNPNANPIDLVPDQIESIQVLKSASAAAIYGAQGANGVILITTKQGRAGKPQFNINFSQGLQQVRKYMPLTNAQEYAMLYNEGLTNAGQDPRYPNPDALGEGTDWQKEMFRVAPMTEVQVSASGGSEASKFYFSTGYTKQAGIIKGSDFDRINLRVNSSHQINKVITVGENLSASYSRYNSVNEFDFGSTLGNTLTASPTVPVKMPDGTWGVDPSSLNASNPAAAISFNNNQSIRPVANGNVYADITPFEGLTYRSQFNFNIGYANREAFVPYYDISALNRNLVANLTKVNRTFREWNWANTVTYNKAIGDHNIELLAGVTAQENRTEYTESYAAGLPNAATESENLRYLDLSTQGARVNGNAGEWGLLSYLGRVNYNYGDRYFTTINFRADGSSRFGENNKFGYFPSFSLGWKVSSESFLKDVAWINTLMLRGGWGSLGNQNSLPNYAFANLITPNQNYPLGADQVVLRGQAPIGMGNPDLKWESTQETNLGFDFTGFNGRITASLDLYNRKTTDMLLRVPVVQSSGIQTSPFVNGGSVRNRGYELALGYSNTTPGGFYYNVSGNVSQNRNKVLELSNNGTALFTFVSFVQNIGITQVGGPVAAFYGYKTDGIFQTQEEVDAHAFQSSGTAPGDIRFQDLNGDGVITALDQTVIGDPWPNLTYGFNTDLEYKNFDFSMNIQGVQGSDIFPSWKFRLLGANFFNYHRDALDRWTGPGTSNDMPRLHNSDPNNNFRTSDFYLEDGSFLRVRNIQIGYKIPQSVVNIRSLRVFASVANAITISKYSGMDPEIGTDNNNANNTDGNPLFIGIDESNYPQPRIYTVGVNIGL